MSLFSKLFGTEVKTQISEEDLDAVSELLNKYTLKVEKTDQIAYNQVSKKYVEIINLFKQFRARAMQIVELTKQTQAQTDRTFSKKAAENKPKIDRLQAERRIIKTTLDVKLGRLGDSLVALTAKSKELGQQTRTIVNDVLKKIADELDISSENRKRLFPSWF